MSLLDQAPIDPAAAAPVEGAAPVTPVVASTETFVAPAAPVRPEGLPDAYWDDSVGVKPEAFARLTALEAEAVARAEGVPDTVDGYTFALPADILGADGKPVAIDKNDPLAKAAATWAKEQGVSDKALSGLLANYAKAEIEAAKADQTALQAEVAKLGPSSKERIAAYTAGVKQHLGVKADALLDSINSAAAAEAVEALLGVIRGIGVTAAPLQPQSSEFEGLTGSALLAAVRAPKAG